MAIDNTLETKKLISIELVFALPERQFILKNLYPVGITIQQVIVLSKIHEAFNEEFDFFAMPVGIFGKLVNPNIYTLKDGDRIEIYRKLDATPNQKRLNRIKSIK